MLLFGRPNVAKLKADRNINGLIKAVGYQKDRDLARTAVAALGEVGDPRAVPALLGALRTEDLWWDAIDALGMLGAAVLEPVLSLLKDEDSGLRLAAVKILNEIGDTRAIEPLLTVLRNDDSDLVRWDTVRTLGKLQDPRTVGPLIDALDDDDHEVRSAAAEALGALGDRQAVEPLIEVLENDESGVRRAAVLALGQLGDERAVEALTAALEDEYYVVRDLAAEALAKLGWQPTPEQILTNSYNAMDTTDSNARCDAAVDLLRQGGIEGVRLLVKALRSGSENLYKGAAWALVNALDRFSGEMDPAELDLTLAEAIPLLTARIAEAKLQSGLSYLNEITIRSLNALAVVGDASSLPALNALLVRLQTCRQQDGYRREYIQTAEYGGWTDNDGNIQTVKMVIEAIEKRAGISA